MKFKVMAGTISMLVMLSTPALAQAKVTLEKPLALRMAQSELVSSRAKALGVKLAGLTNDQILGNIKIADIISHTTVGKTLQNEQLDLLQAQAEALNIDTYGLTENELKIQLKAVGQAKQLASLQLKANSLDLDITGLTNDQARTKIKTAERAATFAHLVADAKTLGIGIDSWCSV